MKRIQWQNRFVVVPEEMFVDKNSGMCSNVFRAVVTCRDRGVNLAIIMDRKCKERRSFSED